MAQADIEALDRFCLELDDELREPVITASAWGLGFCGGAGKSPEERAPASASVSRLPLAKVRATTLDLTGGPFLQRPSPWPTSLADSPVNSICPWCAWERAAAGHGSAARANQFRRVQSCARHSASPEPPSSPVPTAGAEPDSGAGLPSNPNAGCVAAYPKGRWS